MTDSKQIIKGDDNKQIIGSNNLNVEAVNLFMPHRRVLTETLAYTLLTIVYETPLSTETDYQLEDPVPMLEKLRFNHAPRYAALINNHSEDYARVDSVMKEFADSATIIKKLGDMFLAVVEDFDENGNPVVGNGDEQLEEIHARLIEAIVNDRRFDAAAYATELVDQFCIALIACGVSRCKVLVKPD